MKIVLRADGDSITGLGHIMRSSALMQILQPHFYCEFWTKNLAYYPTEDASQLPVVREFIHENVHEDAKNLAEMLSADDVVVLDGYKFDTSYQRILKEKDIKVVSIDDTIPYHFVSDVIINHAGGVGAKSYSCEKYTRLYLGTEYALVKPLFNAAAKPTRSSRNHIALVSLGGADPNNDTDKVLHHLMSLSFFEEIHVIIGQANNHIEILRAKYAHQVFLHQGLSGNAVCKLMQKCDYAILSPSTICYEYMTLGGFVYLYQIADNQEKIKQFFLRNRLAFPFNDLGQSPVEDMKIALQNQKRAFDAKSPQRLLEIFSCLVNEKQSAAGRATNEKQFNYN